MNEVMMLLLPAAAVFFSFVVSVLADFRKYRRMNWQQFSNHATRMAMYLATIGMLIVLEKTDPTLRAIVGKFAYAFAIAEVVGTIGKITTILGGNDPLSQTMQEIGLPETLSTPTAPSKTTATSPPAEPPETPTTPPAQQQTTNPFNAGQGGQ